MASPALGKGLSALFDDDKIAVATKDENNANAQITMVPTLQLRPGPYQPRTEFDETKLKELADSIKENGMIQPIVARHTERDGIYQIIAGERRWRASKILGLDHVPVILHHMADEDALELAIVENIQRQDLSPVEEAMAYKQLQNEFGYTQEKMAEQLGKSRSYIANMLRLLDLPEEVLGYLQAGKLSVGHARAIITSDTPLSLAQDIIEKGLTVREAEKFAKGYQEKKTLEACDTELPAIKKRKGTPASKYLDKNHDIITLEQTLTQYLELKVTIDEAVAGGGRVCIQFDNVAELDKIIQALTVPKE